MLLAHAAVTWALVGLIWTIQVLHYPLFRHVEASAWKDFHESHARRITWLVAVLMPAEVVLAGLMLVRAPGGLAWAGAALLVVVWLSTALLQMPLHRRLGDGYDPHVGRALVRTNWIRTLAWTARGAIAFAMLPPGQ